MNIKLIDDAEFVLKRAWSTKLYILSAVSALGDALLPLITDDISHRYFVILSAICAVAGLAARLIQQDHKNGK